MTIRVSDIIMATKKHWVSQNRKGFQVWECGPTCSTLVATIGYLGEKGLARAKLEIERREKAGAKK